MVIMEPLCTLVCRNYPPQRLFLPYRELEFNFHVGLGLVVCVRRCVRSEHELVL
jgi:hypothetical protein